MRNPEQFYKRLLTLYPRRYRDAFAAEMMQTFLDQCQDLKTSEGRISPAFWLLTLTDEIKNITHQHLTPLKDEATFLGISASKLTVAALLLFPLYAVFGATLVKIALSLPHPPVSGIGVLIALATLLIVPGILSLAASYVFASTLVSVLPRRTARTH